RQARDGRGRAVARRHLGEKHLATDALDKIGADDLIQKIIRAFDEKLRPNGPDQLDRRILLKDDDQIDGGQRGQYFRPGLFGLDRAPRPFQPRGRPVAVETDDEPVASRLGLSEQPDMPRVQQIETAVGEAYFKTLPPPPFYEIECLGAEKHLVYG